MFRFSTFQLWSKKKNEDKNSRGYTYGQGNTDCCMNFTEMVSGDRFFAVQVQ